MLCKLLKNYTYFESSTYHNLHVFIEKTISNNIDFVISHCLMQI